MFRWFIGFAVATIVLIALFAEIASIVTSQTVTATIASIATTVVAATATLAVFGQWQFPQPSPQRLSRGWVWGVSIYFVLLLLAGTLTDLVLGFQSRPDNSFAHIVKGKTTINTDFLTTLWDHDLKTSGSCSPQTTSYDLVTKLGLGNYSCLLTSKTTLAGNMALEVDMKIHSGDEAGVIFKYTEVTSGSTKSHNYYRYSVNVSNGTYQLSKFLADKPTLLDDAQKSTINKGVDSTNTLELTVIGNEICLYANQIQLHCIPDTQPYETGTIGLQVGHAPVNSKGSVTFSALKVWQL